MAGQCQFLLCFTALVMAVHAKQPHIIMILQDDLGYFDVAFHAGVTKRETANISALAAEGIVLNRHYTHWHCSPSRRSFLSGRWPIHHGEQLSNNCCSDDIDLRFSWVSDKLASAGYSCHWVGKGHTGYSSMHHLPINHGFQSMFGYLSGSQSYSSTDRWEDAHPVHNMTEYSSNLYGQMAVDIVRNHSQNGGDAPLLLYLAFQAVHVPYDPVPNWDSQVCPGYPGPDYTYCGMLWDADLYVGALVNELKASGMWADTLIVYSADNGGVEAGINFPLRGEKHTNWEGGLRTAAFVAGGVVPSALQGTTSNVTIHIADWYATFSVLAGVSPSDDPPVPPLPVDVNNTNLDIYGSQSFPPLDSVNIWPYLIGPTMAASASAHDYLVLSKEVIVAGDWKLVVAQPNFKVQNNGWRQPNGSWENSSDIEWPCNAQDGPLTQVLPGRGGQPVCLFNVTADKSERFNLASFVNSLAIDLL